MKKLLSVLLAAMMLMSLAMPAMASETVVPIKIATWTSNESQLALLGSFVDEFAAAKGIKIDATFESISFNEYNTKLLLELNSDSAPDLYWVLETAAPAFIASGNLAVLNDALAAYNPEDIAESALALWKDGDSVYAVPFSTSPFIMLYNADLFAQAGAKTPDELIAEGNWTWESFREVSKQIKDATGVWGFQTVDGDGYNTRTLHTLLPIIRSFGGDAWNENGEVLIDTDESIAAVQLFLDMVYVDGSVVPPGELLYRRCRHDREPDFPRVQPGRSDLEVGHDHPARQCARDRPSCPGRFLQGQERRIGCRIGGLHDQRILRSPHRRHLAACPLFRAGIRSVPDLQQPHHR